MDKIRQIIDGLNEEERQTLLLELLRPVLKELDGERSVLGESGQVVGYVMPADTRMLLIPAHLADRKEDITQVPRRPVSEFKQELEARLRQEV